MNEQFDIFQPDYRADSAVVHQSSIVDAPCRIGEHTTVHHFSYVGAHTLIGSHCYIGRNVTIGSGVLIGDNVRVMHNAQLSSGVILQDDVLCGAGAIFCENRYMKAQPRSISRVSPTLVRQGAQIGPNATIANGFTIGAHAFVEAGTIVDRNVPDFAVVSGNPLKFAGWRCECGQLLNSPGDNRAAISSLQCKHCDRSYSRQSRWKMLQLTQGSAACDSDSEFDPTVRQAQRPD